MTKINNIDTEALNKIIVGRVDPKIYAFTTQTVPNYLKIGDTYRPIEVRMNEWRKYFPNLKKKSDWDAKIDDQIFFRDYAVHQFLEHDIEKSRLQPEDIQDIPHYSQEFFKDTAVSDVDNAIEDIKKAHKKNENKYQYYTFEESRIPEKYVYNRTEDYAPRPNQKETIKRFNKALKKGRTNLLMYAVMRFGKSFTSMCCATEMNANLVVIVSAKADVKEEWKKTVESHIRFEDYQFIDSDALQREPDSISKNRKGNKKTVLFLTLQDLQGEDIKQKHKDLFKNEIDLLLIDETHFGARASEYGKVLKYLPEIQSKKERELDEDNLDILDDSIKVLNSRVRIHLSGTPYRILMGGEFSEDDVIAFYQFTNIAEDQEAWDENNLHKDDIKEWDNPYYGFPQMVRFAFNPNTSSFKRMEEMKKDGITYTFSALLKPQSVSKDNKKNLHKKFKYEKEVHDLFKTIDGSKQDKNILGFLEYDKIKEGKMCRHMVYVLPYRASCDALEELIKNNSFKNLSEYEILNISGVDGKKKFKDPQAVTNKIKKLEKENKKTLTLTVNRMLTGSTVPEWDTMLYLKDTASPQEYDQAIFRLQSQYIKTYTDSKGDTVKYNMKPQTLLVDFDPARMFQIQEHKAQIYNVNTDANGNSKLEERIQRELQISPIIVLNNKKINQVEPTDILDSVRQYSSSRSVVDEARAISVDFSLLDIPEIRSEIQRQGKIGSRQGLEIKAVDGEGDELDIQEAETSEKDKTEQENEDVSGEKDQESDFKEKFAMFYARILFFAFLTDERIISLEDVVSILEKNKNNLRIAQNIGLSKDVLVLFKKHSNPYVLSSLDYKIQNINSLANDTALNPVERAGSAMRKFNRLSDSEIVTPEKIAAQVIDSFPNDAFSNKNTTLDIASKQGEFVYAVYKKYGKKVANNFYSIPTSKIAYEFTRKVYSLLELDIKNIESNYTSYDLLENDALISGDNVKINNDFMKFDAIVGNPPYQEKAQGRSTGDNPIYHLFMDIAYASAPVVVLITPGRFLFDAGKTPKSWNMKMLTDEHFRVLKYESDASKIFQNTAITGGVAITLRDQNKKFEPIEKFFAYEELKRIAKKVENSKSFESLQVVINIHSKFNLDALYKKYPEYKKIIGSNGKDKRVRSNAFEKIKKIFNKENSNESVRILGLENKKRVYRFVNDKYIDNPEWLYKWKVFVPESNGASGMLGEDAARIISKPVVGIPGDGVTQTFIVIGSLNSKKEAYALEKYILSKFVRVLLGALKVTQRNNSEAWALVPLQDFSQHSDIDWSKSIEDVDQQLYKKYKLNKEEIDFIEKMIKPME